MRSISYFSEKRSRVFYFLSVRKFYVSVWDFFLTKEDKTKKFWYTVKPLNRGHLRVLKNLSVTDRCPLLGGNSKKTVTYGTKHFVRYSRHVRYLECLYWEVSLVPAGIYLPRYLHIGIQLLPFVKKSRKFWYKFLTKGRT